MTDITFPTLRQRGPSSYTGEVIKVWQDINANYAKGKEGLFITVRSESGTSRDLFYPMPPSAKGNRLLKALVEELEIDVGKIGWEGLQGYVFRWATEMMPMTITDRDSGEKKDITVQLEFPVEIIKLPEDDPINTTPDAPTDAEEAPPSAEDGKGVAVPPTNNSTANWELFLDDVLILADGKDLRELRLAAAESNTIRAYDPALRQRLNKGEATEELISQGRLKEEDSKFIVALS